MYVKYSEEHKIDKVTKGKIYRDLLDDEASKVFVTQVQKVGADYNEKLHVKKERAYIYIGDELGYLKIWDMQTFIDEFGLKQCKSFIELKGNYNPTRKESVDCSAYTN